MSRPGQESLSERPKWKKVSKKGPAGLLSSEALKRHRARMAALGKKEPQFINVKLPRLNKILYVGGEQQGGWFCEIVPPKKLTFEKGRGGVEAMTKAFEKGERFITFPMTKLIPAVRADIANQATKELTHSLAKLSNAVADLDSRFEQMTQRLEARLK